MGDPSPYASTRSLSVDGITFTSSSATPLSNNIFRAVNTVLNLTNVYAHDISLTDSSFTYGENSTGHWENNYFKNIQPGTATFFLEQDLIWTFINQTFENVPAYSSWGILRLSTYFEDRPGANVTFGGDITFIDCPAFYSDSIGEYYWIQDTAIAMIHEASTPIYILSLPSNPSHFILKNSNMSLFTLQAKYDNTIQQVEVGSIFANSTMPGNTEDTMRYLFCVDPWDTDDAPYFIYNTTAAISHISVTGNIESHGTGIISRGYGFTEGPTDYLNNAKFTVGGSITVTYDSALSNAFRLIWPIDVTASSLVANLIPSSNGLVSSFTKFPASSVYSNIATTRFSIAGTFKIASTNTPIDIYSDIFEGSQVKRASASVTPYSELPPIFLENGLLTLDIVSGVFTMANFSRETSNSYSADKKGGAIALLEGSIFIRAEAGDVTFSGNQNIDGDGGAVWLSYGAEEFYLDASANIVFSDNVARFGGALFIDNSNGEPDFSFNAEGNVQLLRNLAIDAGGAALLPYSFVHQIFPQATVSISGNGAGSFGCVFAFDTTEATSDAAWDSTCAAGSYVPPSGGPNYRIITAYENSTHCPAYEDLCYALPPEPIAPPTVPTTPTVSTTPTVPSTTPSVPAPVGCRATGNIPTGSTCVNGTYQVTSQGFIAYIAATIANGTAPKIDAPIVITGGNVSLSAVTVANIFLKSSSTAMITSTDCVQIASLSVSLTSDDVSTIQTEKEVTSTLIQSSCSPSGTLVLAVGATPKKSCQKTKVDTTSTATTLQATFSVSSSKCDNWWIILVSVISGVLLLVIIAVVIILLLPEEMRSKLQPFHKTKDAPVSKGRVYSNID